MKANNNLKSRMKKLCGTIRSKVKNGNLYYRLTIASSLRKEFPLKTKDEAEAKGGQAKEAAAKYWFATASVLV